MDSLFYERLHSFAPQERPSSTRSAKWKPFPHKPSTLSTRYCHFKLKLHVLQYDKIHRGVAGRCPTRWIKTNFTTVAVKRQNSILAHWKPFVNGVFSRLIPSVYAKDKVSEVQSEEEELGTHEMAGTGEQPVEMLADQIMRNETGWERVNEMYSRQEGGGQTTLSPEIMNILGVVFNTSVITLMFGYFLGHNKCSQEFAEKHYHTKWQTKFRAARAYRDAVFIEGMKFGAKLAARTTAFVAIWLVVATTISVYRNKTSFVEHVAAGAITGTIYGLNMGLKGMFSRGVIGATFGLVSGTVLYFGFTSFNDTQEQRRYWTIVSRLQESRELQRMLRED